MIIANIYRDIFVNWNQMCAGTLLVPRIAPKQTGQNRCGPALFVLVKRSR